MLGKRERELWEIKIAASQSRTPRECTFGTSCDVEGHKDLRKTRVRGGGGGRRRRKGKGWLPLPSRHCDIFFSSFTGAQSRNY
ncbi:hypothetical protein PUN28_004991 [Cardiocondyla obscurior]|uniref:Uncharacterized protein n=1 Tax=Cardiocondyla obscurior TaxID=286306 RepID=A0AAW2GE14_9HYME